MAVSFYRSPSANAAKGLDSNNKPVPSGAIIFSKDANSLTGKIYVQTGDAGDTNTLYCYGEVNEAALNAIVEDINTKLGTKLEAKDLSGYMHYMGEVANKGALPDSKHVVKGDVYRVASTGVSYYAKEITSADTTIRIIFEDRNGGQHVTTYDVGEGKDNVISLDEYNREIARISGQFTEPFNDSKYPYVSGIGNMPTFTQGDKRVFYDTMKMVPVLHPSRGLIVVLTPQKLGLGANDDWNPDSGAQHRFHTVALGVNGADEINAWKMGAVSRGELIWCENGVIPTDTSSINEFGTLAGGVVWTDFGGGSGGSAAVEVDSTLQDGSVNPTQGGAVKQYVDTEIAAIKQQLAGIGSCFDVKGSVANMDLLEAKTDVENGDVWYVESEKAAYFAFVDKDGKVTWNPFATLNLEWH